MYWIMAVVVVVIGFGWAVNRHMQDMYYSDVEDEDEFID